MSDYNSLTKLPRSLKSFPTHLLIDTSKNNNLIYSSRSITQSPPSALMNTSLNNPTIQTSYLPTEIDDSKPTTPMTTTVTEKQVQVQVNEEISNNSVENNEFLWIPQGACMEEAGNYLCTI